MSNDVLRHIPALRLFARSLTGRHYEADDLVQDTLLRAISSSASYTAATDLRAWLLSIMRIRFLTESVEMISNHPKTDAHMAHTLSSLDRQPLHVCGSEIQAAIMGLPLAYREAVMLNIVLGESHQASAQILGVAVGTIKSRISRGRELLQLTLGAKD